MAERHITDSFKYDGDVLKTMKSIPFVLSHTLVRAVSFPIIAAFLKPYAAIAFGLLLVINFAIAMKTMGQRRMTNVVLRSVAYGLCAPAIRGGRCSLF